MISKEIKDRLREEITSIRDKAVQEEAARKTKVLEMEKVDENWSLVKPSISGMIRELNRDVLSMRGEATRVEAGPYMDGVVLKVQNIGTLTVFKIFRLFETQFDGAARGEQFKRVFIVSLPESFNEDTVEVRTVSLLESQEEIINQLEEAIPAGLIGLYKKALL